MTPSAELDVLHCSLDGIDLIEASAGTGKTWTICGLYLRLLLEREWTVQQILVVTFTQAATAELRERIRARLTEMVAYTERGSERAADRFIPELAAKLDSLGIDARRRGELLQRALASFDEASIFTIHGFCQRALADSAFSAGLPLRMELVEDDRELVLEAVNDFWRRHVANAAVSPEFARYLHAQHDTPRSYAKLLERHLAKPWVKTLWPADIESPPLATAALDASYQRLQDTWTRERGAIQDVLLRSLAALNANSYSTAAVRDGAMDWTRLCAVNSPLGAAGKKSKLYRASVLVAGTKKKCTTPQHVFFDQAEEYCVLRERVEASLQRARLRLLRRLFDEATAQLRQSKASRQVISFADMLSNVYERLQHPDYPWLAASIRSRFPAALIDEFQDTDPLQFDIFRAIYRDGERQVFVVGDPKQAIYSFRHADLHTYLRAKRWATGEWSLAANQRSSEPLVAALNGLFGGNEHAFILPGLDYRRVHVGDKRRAKFLDATLPRAPLTLWELPRDPAQVLSKRDARVAAVGATCAEIARLIEAGARGEITLDDEPLRPRHIAVLVRTRALGAEVKRALAELRVGAVEMSRESIFESPEAEALETVLTAVLSPTRESRVRAALATELFGCDMRAIEALSASETLSMERIQQFIEYRELWQSRGVGVMYRRLLADQAVAQRMLARPDGERRLTNFLHLGDMLQHAGESYAAPEALLQYLKSTRERDANTEGFPQDAAQLRLESDQNLVQILTIHTCKGLEFPIVFLPFVCEGLAPPGGPSLQGSEYHDALLEPVIDFRQLNTGDPAAAAIANAILQERAAERVRLVYVALTRAVHRCYMVVGRYKSRTSIKESSRSMLNWLVAGRGATFDAWMQADPQPAAIDAAWREYAAALPNAVALYDLPRHPGMPVNAGPSDEIVEVAEVARELRGAWRLSSYSNLHFGAQAERAAGDYDERVADIVAGVVTDDGEGGGRDVGAADIVHFPRGASAGECIHAVFEHIDFADESTWGRAIEAALQAHPQRLPSVPVAEARSVLSRMLHSLIEQVVATELRHGLRLRSVSTRRRLTELEFIFPVPRLVDRDFNELLDVLGYAVGSLRFDRLEGYLKGFIDLVFEHEGQYFIVDWKSNHMGYAALDYAEEPLAAQMIQHGYHLQYLIYTVALDRYLRQRLPDYRYETHVGGVLYLFVRGVRPAWTDDEGRPRGVYFHRPSLAAITRLDALLRGSA